MMMPPKNFLENSLKLTFNMSNPKENTTLPHRDQITNFQINTLLNVAGLLANVLTNPMREFEGVPSPALDGGIKTSAEASFINACNRIDEIVSDPARWTFKMQEHLEYKLGEIYSREIQLKEAQLKSVNEVNSPHFLYKPTLVRLKDGTYAAILGDLNDVDNSLVGVGLTPADAMKSFDEAFNGQPDQAMIDWLEKQSASAPKKKKK